jgi:hypothetical protein
VPVRHARTPRGPLYRIGLLPDPLTWPPREYLGSGRFDDPRREFRVLYAATRRGGAFVETLARFRPLLEAMARQRQVIGAEEPEPGRQGIVPAGWYHRRAVIRLCLGPGQRWLDLRAPQTREALRRELAATLLALGFTDLDLSAVVGPRRQLTQAIARWAYERGYAGLAYSSRLDAALGLWAIFEGAAFAAVGLPEPIVATDPDLLATARLFGLLPGRGPSATR